MAALGFPGFGEVSDGLVGFLARNHYRMVRVQDVFESFVVVLWGLVVWEFYVGFLVFQ